MSKLWKIPPESPVIENKVEKFNVKFKIKRKVYFTLTRIFSPIYQISCTNHLIREIAVNFSTFLLVDCWNDNASKSVSGLINIDGVTPAADQSQSSIFDGVIVSWKFDCLFNSCFKWYLCCQLNEGEIIVVVERIEKGIILDSFDFENFPCLLNFVSSNSNCHISCSRYDGAMSCS